MSLRKILIPAVAGLMISPALMAANIETSTMPTSESDEWLQTADSTDTVAGGELTVILGAEYAVGDIVTISFSGGALETGLLSSIPVPQTGNISGITLGLLSSDADTATYRVTDIALGDEATTVGAIIPIGGDGALIFDAPSVDAAGTIVVSYSAATGTGLALDTGGGPDGGECTTSACNSVDYITTGPQYGSKVTMAFKGVIDVDNNRETFEEAAVMDIMIATQTDIGRTFTKSATLEAEKGYDVVVSGDFSFLVDSDLMTPELEPITGVVALADSDCVGMVVTVTDITFNCTTTGAATITIDLTLNVSGTPPVPAILPAGAFSITVDVNFTGIGGTGTKQLLSGSAGAWILNGFQSFLPYVPYGPGISQVIYLVNRGLKSGDITVDWVDANGATGTLGVVATLAATTVFSVGPTIQAALPTAQSGNGRLALTITANVPAKDVQINSQYNVSGNRAFIASEDNRP